MIRRVRTEQVGNPLQKLGKDESLACMVVDDVPIYYPDEKAWKSPTNAERKTIRLTAYL